MLSANTTKRCRCHSTYLYDNLTACPACGHNSFDDYYANREVKGWAGCERRACGYERPAAVTPAFNEIHGREEA